MKDWDDLQGIQWIWTCINLVITKYKLKSQYVKLTQLLTLSKICVLCTYVDQMIIQQRLMFCFEISVTIFLLMFFPLFLKVFTNGLKIFDLPKMYNKIPKYCQTPVFTIIIYQVNSTWQLHLASELYCKCALGGKWLFWH